MSRHRAAPVADRAGFVAVLRIRLFAALFAAETQSIIGDQLARVALSVLVFDETGSAPATAATYAATLLPAVVGGVVLGRIGDRFPRRAVMIACDLFRALCFGLMAIPGVPLGVLIGLVVVAVTLGPLFSAAEVSLLSERLPAEQFRTGNALRMIATQAAQVGGFVLGGLIVALLGPGVTLSLDAVTFVLSAVLVLIAERDPAGVRPAHPAPAQARLPAAPGPFPGVWSDRRLRSLVALAALIGFFVVPEGLAVPYGDSVNATTAQVGLLLAAGAAGGAAGALGVVRWRHSHPRERVAGWMAVLCGLPLLTSALNPTWPVAALGWFVSGVFAAYMVEATTLIVHSIPESERARVVGLLSSLLLAAQGAALIAFGAVSHVLSAGSAIAMAGLVGSILALALVTGPLRTAHWPATPQPSDALPRR